jgi:hypothetical protein
MQAAHWSTLADPYNWIVAVTTLAIVSLCVGTHFEVLSRCNRYIAVVSRQRRRRVVVLILLILLTHVVEMWYFAIGYYVLIGTFGLGSLVGAETNSLVDFAYYSAMTYTTVGFGDIAPLGAIRFMTGMEALTGLVMITWSASFTFLEMQRDWPPSER